MNEVISILLLVLVLVGNFAGTAMSFGRHTEVQAPAETIEAPTADDEPLPGEALDMKAFLTDLVRENPQANAGELCAVMLESPYFKLFREESTEYYYPALDYEFQPEGVKEAACIWDAFGEFPTVVYVFEPEEGADAEALARSLENAVDPWWSEKEMNTLAFTESGKVLFALYPDEMLPVEGEIAGKARDIVDLFHEYLARDPEADPLEMAGYFSAHQKIAALNVREVEPGRLTGFGDFDAVKEITGFAQGAIFEPNITPNTFIGYVFRLDDEADVPAFEKLLQDSANLYWNVCVGADTIITETDGTYVLFMMCTEKTGE